LRFGRRTGALAVPLRGTLTHPAITVKRSRGHTNYPVEACLSAAVMGMGLDLGTPSLRVLTPR
jgi:hypothetical protein